ncbi:TonB-dependent copper receptor [Shewanella denitrificans OS217]|uniref:TonB-dependent copper receptor n=1 Tax=Shewanella denitrificans (strain OS217 / ATCC BAA-1090 / DSM 15013) TaxID=318161 RepID=Q12S14_SHEDO|nr:TonB-dependent copper receptor [Shewanella denitrificans]ABE53762.1 TonB-dependent copper receptor [Shewanella denitrificans OS217]
MGKTNFKLSLLAGALVMAMQPSVQAQEQHNCTKDEKCNDYLVVTGDVMREPVNVVSDPKKPRLPLPAFEGSGFLKTIPGFSVTRKGGMGGDPSFRGMGGSRLAIVDDGQHVYGACGGRMDPPTNYIYPESYDEITVIKGPQTVKYGPVGSAGTVLFEKNRHRFTERGIIGRASITGGSFDRKDSIIEFVAGNADYYVDFDMDSSSSDHYKDGNDNPVQSSYDRDNIKVALGWTPSENTVIEFAMGQSEGEAEYADRLNKARQIDNESYTLLVQHDFDSELLKNVDFQVYSNENDHIMDQFDRGVNMGMDVMRSTSGGHFWLGLTPMMNWDLTLGVDHMQSDHQGRGINMMQDKGLDDLLRKPFMKNMEYANWGLFVESVYHLDHSKVFAGMRYDNWDTDLYVGQKGNRADDVFSGYARYEYRDGFSQYYAGVGHAERVPDYWEIMKTSASNPMQKSFDLEPEETNQLDIGWIYDNGLVFSSSLFYGKLDNYILVDSTGPMTVARNIDATLYGGEASIDYDVNEHFSAQVTLSYTLGDNDTDNVDLGQVSPLESKFSLNYQKDAWAAGLLWRVVDSQHRVTIGHGNIVGQDLAESSGFGTVAINASWNYDDHLRLILGVENLFDIAYAEHISKAAGGNDLPGSEPMFQVNESGRNFWAKLTYEF